MPAIAIVRGGGDLASGVALRLHRAGIGVVVTELPEPLAVRRTVSYAEAVYEGAASVEGVTGRRVDDPSDSLRILGILAKQQIPVLIDPECISAQALHPLLIVDGRMRKRPPESLRHSALLYIGLGPGFYGSRELSRRHRDGARAHSGTRHLGRSIAARHGGTGGG